MPLKMTLIYAMAGCLWILFSDLVLSVLVKDPFMITRIQIIKGWAFIAATALMLYMLIKRDVSAIRRSEQALRESEEKFHLVVENTSSAIFVYRERILIVNRAMQDLTGYDRDELLTMNLYDIVHPDFREEIREHCEAFPRNEATPLRCEYKIITKMGEDRWIDFTSSIISYCGEPSGLGTAFDITERKHAEEALRESEERFRLLIERITDYEIFMLDPQGYILSWNIGAQLNKGYLPEEIIGKHHSIFFTPDDIRKGVPEEELSAAAMANRYENEGWRVRKDGSLFWANVVIASLRDNEGRLRGFIKVVRDITARKRAEDALRESEERHRVIAETASDVIITIDEESRILFVNPAVEKVFGFTPEELVGKPITVLMPERLRIKHLQGVKRYLETGKKHMNWKAIELPGLRKDGVEVPLEISYGEFTKDGRHFFSGVVRDVSERKLAEKEKEYKDMLERFTQELETRVAERTMGLMALTLADRIRNPVSVISWTARRILEREEVSEKLKEALTTVTGEAAKLETLVKDFQSMLKSRQSMFSYEDLNEILSDVLVLFEREAAEKKIELQVNLSERPLKMNAQKDLLRIAAFNLLRNAVEATPQGGRIRVESSGDPGIITLSVSDSGPGIPNEILDRIFDPFFSTKVHRFGMGLPLLKQIVSEHMGRIDVESDAGKGTTFRLFFPARWGVNTEGGLHSPR